MIREQSYIANRAIVNHSRLSLSVLLINTIFILVYCTINQMATFKVVGLCLQGPSTLCYWNNFPTSSKACYDCSITPSLKSNKSLTNIAQAPLLPASIKFMIFCKCAISRCNNAFSLSFCSNTNWAFSNSCCKLCSSAAWTCQWLHWFLLDWAFCVPVKLKTLRSLASKK